MEVFFVCITVVLSRLTFTASEESQINVVLKHSTCNANKNYIDKMTSTRKPLNRTTSLTSMDIYFNSSVTLESPIYIQFIANKKFTTLYRPFMVNLRGELCTFLSFKNHPFYLIVSSNTNKSESNMLDPCPLKGHRYVQPYYTSYKELPPLVPIGMWRTDVIVTKEFEDQEIEIFRFQDYYEVSAKGIIEF